MQLPALGFDVRNALLDVSPITNAIDGNRRNALMQRESARQDQELQMRREQQAYQRGRDAQSDHFAKIKRGGEVAMAIQQMDDADPGKAQAWQRYLKSFGDGDHSPEELDFRTGPKLAAAAAGQYLDPMKRQSEMLDMEYKRAQINSLNRKEIDQNTPANRATNAARYGLDPNSDAYKAYVLTGRLPREDQQSLTATDKKEIFKSEDAIPVLESTISALNRASKLNAKAYTGYTAGLRAGIGSRAPDWMVPDFIANPQESSDTKEFNSLMSMEAIKTMAETLKGATTDQELSRFVDILGDPTTPPEIRSRTIDRMLTLAHRQKDIATNRLDQLRGGSYYKPGGGSAAANPMTFENGSGDPLAEAKAAIGRGADPAKVRQRLIENGVDPEGL